MGARLGFRPFSAHQFLLFTVTVTVTLGCFFEIRTMDGRVRVDALSSLHESAARSAYARSRVSWLSSLGRDGYTLAAVPLLADALHGGKPAACNVFSGPLPHGTSRQPEQISFATAERAAREWHEPAHVGVLRRHVVQTHGDDDAEYRRAIGCA